MSVVFETPRIILRHFTEEDANLILQLNSDPEVIKYVHEPLLETEEQAKKVIANIILPQYENNLGRWAMYAKETDEFIGWCGLKYLAEKDQVDLGYRLKRSAWGKGYATEAAEHTLKFGFNYLQLHIIYGTAHSENFASLKVLKKIGMKFLRDSIEDNCPIKIHSISRQQL